MPVQSIGRDTVRTCGSDDSWFLTRLSSVRFTRRPKASGKDERPLLGRCRLVRVVSRVQSSSGTCQHFTPTNPKNFYILGRFAAVPGL